MVHFSGIFLKMSCYKNFNVPGRRDAEEVVPGVIDFQKVCAEPVMDAFLGAGVICI